MSLLKKLSKVKLLFKKLGFGAVYWLKVCISMAKGFGPLAEITWIEKKRRSAILMILVRKGDSLTNSQISDLTGVDSRRVGELHKGPKGDQGP